MERQQIIKMLAEMQEKAETAQKEMLAKMNANMKSMQQKMGANQERLETNRKDD
jgi:hypothetical protein